MAQYTVNFTEISRKTDIKLSTFAQETIANIKDNERYKDLGAAFTDYEAKGNAYIAAFTAALNKGQKEVATKKQTKADYLAQTKAFSLLLGANSKDDLTYITDAGFPLSKVRSVSTSPSFLDPPFGIIVSSNGIAGCLSIEFKLKSRSNTKLTQVRISVDKGLTWDDDYYFYKLKNVISGLPNNTTCYVSFRNLGSDNLKSAWTEPVIASTL
jgi:hypothetical protein